MPSTMTHTYFGMDVYSKLNLKCQNKIKNSKEYFKLFCQGSDPFMFYNFFIGKKAREVRLIQKMMHRTKTREFFLATIGYIHDNKLSNNDEAMAYLYGFICHYFLDLNTHPYLHYKGGFFDKDDKASYKYNAVHQEIEYAIDLYFIGKRELVTPSKFKVYKKIYDVKGLSPTLKDIINNSIGVVYSLEGIDNTFERSIWYMKNFFRFANYDPYGVKLKVYKLLDRVTPEGFTRLEELSFSNVYDNIDDYLNLDHRKWCLPWDKSKCYNSSFLDMYEVAIEEAVRAIEIVTAMLDSKRLDKVKLKEIFKNLSFSTGLPCKENVKLKYFEF